MATKDKDKNPISNKQDERSEIMSRIVVKAWTDPNFEKRLLKQPREVLEEEGFVFEVEGKGAAKVVFHVDSEQEKHFVIPTPPDILSLKSEQLLLLAAQRIAIQLELF